MRRIIDLSHPISDNMPVFPGDPEVTFEQTHHIKDGGYNVTRICFGTHTGTHVDVPHHCTFSDKTVDMLNIDTLVGWADIIDLGEVEPCYDIVAADLDEHADYIEAGGRVLIKTGWSKRFGEPEFYTKFPGLTEGAVLWLNARKVKLVGLEQPSVHQRGHKEVHTALLDAGVVLVESLANMDKITQERVYIVALPINIEGGDGAPMRVIAIEGMQVSEE